MSRVHPSFGGYTNYMTDRRTITEHTDDGGSSAPSAANGMAGPTTRVAIVVGSTRPGRRARAVAEWVLAAVGERDGATFELVDLADYSLPLLDEPMPAAMGPTYSQPHTKAWSAAIASFDAFVFVTPEYNHSMTAVLKNAVDYLFDEWNDKAAGFVSYGLQGGTRAVEHLRLVVAEVKIADVRTQVALSLHSDFDRAGGVQPDAHHLVTVTRMLDELVAWADALKPLRVEQSRA